MLRERKIAFKQKDLDSVFALQPNKFSDEKSFHNNGNISFLLKITVEWLKKIRERELKDTYVRFRMEKKHHKRIFFFKSFFALSLSLSFFSNEEWKDENLSNFFAPYLLLFRCLEARKIVCECIFRQLISFFCLYGGFSSEQL